MKRISSLFAVAAVFAACNSTPKTGAEVKPLTSQGVTILADTTGLSEFQAWKNQKDQGLENNAIAPGTKTVVGYADDNNTSVAKAAPVRKRSVATRTTRSRTANRTYSSGSSTVYAPAPSTTTTTTRKKGWSKAAKGAAIGGGSGAVLGAIISKNKGKGAIIGGVIGAAGGYVIGRGKDKKDGRY